MCDWKNNTALFALPFISTTVIAGRSTTPTCRCCTFPRDYRACDSFFFFPARLLFAIAHHVGCYDDVVAGRVLDLFAGQFIYRYTPDVRPLGRPQVSPSRAVHLFAICAFTRAISLKTIKMLFGRRIGKVLSSLTRPSMIARAQTPLRNAVQDYVAGSTRTASLYGLLCAR